MLRSSKKMALGKGRLLTTRIKNILLVSMVMISYHILHAQAPNLGVTSDFALFTASGAFNNVGASTVVTGDVGTHVGAFNAFPPGTLIGSRHIADVVSAQAAADVLTAYTYLDGLTCGMVLGTTMGSGQILTPDIYCLGAASTINGNLILDAQGDVNASFIFQIDGALSTTTLSNVQLINGASACNLYWQINGAVALGERSVFVGTMLVQGAISLLQGATLNGRGLSTAGAISLAENIVNLRGGSLPTASVITDDGPTTFCVGDSVTLSGNVGGIWSNDMTNASIVVKGGGDYYVINANGCGRDTSNHIIVTVLADILAPEIVCPPNVTIQLGPSSCATIVTFALATATDNCSDAADITITSDIISGSVFQVGEQVITFEAQDMAGNTATCSFTVTVLDFVLPSLGCKDVNFSLDENCEGVLTPTTVLTGWENESGVGCEALFDITIEGKNGAILGNTITHELLGKTLDYTITHANGFICSGSLTVEDKIKPTFICPSVPLSINCLTNLSTVPPPVVVDNCSGAVAVLVNEVHEALECDPTYIGSITRIWQAADGAGNKSLPCTQTIYLQRSSNSGITPPPANVTLRCSDLYKRDSKGLGYPSPDTTGVPMLGATRLYPLSQLNMIYCNSTIDYTDQLVTDTKCKKRIFRTWSITEWWCSTTVPIFVGMQLIDIIDDVAPNIPGLENITVTTQTRSCSAAVQLPKLSITDNCNDIYKVYINATLDGEPSGYVGANGGLIELSVGTHSVTYSAFDVCGNSSTMTYRITVRDDTDPVAICDQFATVSLKNNGYTEVTASAIDDGSFDECGAVTLQVRRMEDPCSFGADTAWYDKVGFCCLDANTTRMVQLLVTDKGGNTNICMVSVNIQDKVVPSMTCPNDMTIENCNFIFDPSPAGSIAAFGGATVIDNCPSNVPPVYTLVDNRNQCGTGEVIRTITLSENGVLLQTCTQKITFRNDDPFFINRRNINDPDDDVIWPKDYLALGQCSFAGLLPETLPDSSSVPRFTEDACDLVGMKYEDKIFPFTTNGACYKIIRTWTIIDWCQKNDDGTHLTWTYEQEIKVIDNVRPTLTVPTTTQIFNTSNCTSFEITLAATATDCTPQNDLRWTYSITKGNTLIRTGSTRTLTDTFPVGDYRIQFTVEDRCGNLAEGGYNFSVRTTKSATAICKNGLSAALVPMGTPPTLMAMLPVEFFDNKSYHVCGYTFELSYSSNVNNDTIAFTTPGCKPIQMWVTDQNGNTSFCETFVDIQLNGQSNNCNNGGNPLVSTVSGRTIKENEEVISDVIVVMEGTEANPVTTNNDGRFVFEPMTNGGAYNIIPGKDGDDLNGVSTLDLVMIQRHILGLEKLGTPYKLLAADVNQSASITASDLTELRKLILGLNPEFTNNTSWRFFDAAHKFADANDPWRGSLTESYAIENLNNSMDLSFIGVKVGDVNGNAKGSNATQDNTSSRSAFKLAIDNKKVFKGEIIEVPVMVEHTTDFYGLQAQFATNGIIIRDVKAGAVKVNPYDYAITSPDQVWMALALGEGQRLQAGKTMFTLELEILKDGNLDEMLTVGTGLNPEAYTESMDVKSLTLNWRSDNSGFNLTSVSPNPWNTQTEIQFELPEDGMVTFKVRDYTGKKVISTVDQFNAGQNSIRINRADLGTSGVYVYEIRYGQKVLTGKMIVIE
jgi:hypothetical protein